jgi:hypothetical protein
MDNTNIIIGVSLIAVILIFFFLMYGVGTSEKAEKTKAKAEKTKAKASSSPSQKAEASSPSQKAEASSPSQKAEASSPSQKAEASSPSQKASEASSPSQKASEAEAEAESANLNGEYVLQNNNNKRCLTHANLGNGKGPIENWYGPVFCDPTSSNFTEQALWKLTEHPSIKGSYVLQNKKNNGCLTHSSGGNSTGPIEDRLGASFCDPTSSDFSERSLWKLTEHPSIKSGYVLENTITKGCLIHGNTGNGKGPIINQSGASFCDPTSSDFSDQALWTFIKK